MSEFVDTRIFSPSIAVFKVLIKGNGTAFSLLRGYMKSSTLGS